MWKSRWPSWAPVPNKPTVSVDVKQHFNNEDVLPVQSIYLVFTHMPGKSYRRRVRSLLMCLYDVFRVVINSPCFFLSQSKLQQNHAKSHTDTSKNTKATLKCLLFAV